jgi:hypothetical protein
MAASAAPPRTVKSSAWTTARRPSMRPWPTDRVGRHEARQLARVVVLALARDGAGLVEAAGVEEALDALAHGELAGGVLARDALGPAHPAGELLAASQLVELGLPRHRQGVCRTSPRCDHHPMAVGRSAVAVLAALSVTAAVGCGARTSPRPRRRRSPTIPGRRRPSASLALPPGVPDMSTGPAESRGARVINELAQGAAQRQRQARSALLRAAEQVPERHARADRQQ